uniref:Uncharacterized protein n=1 Tax=Anguilla anguilla TaxID=7936 RepID=A0A0E9QGZ5_ANGAN
MHYRLDRRDQNGSHQDRKRSGRPRFDPVLSPPSRQQRTPSYEVYWQSDTRNSPHLPTTIDD